MALRQGTRRSAVLLLACVCILDAAAHSLLRTVGGGYFFVDRLL